MRGQVTALVVLLAGAAACEAAGPPSAAGPSYRLEAVGGLDQVAEATLAVPEPPAVRVLRDGKPVAGERIDFRIIDGDGSGTLVVTSGADGVARMPTWVLGPVLGPQRLLATLLSAPSITRNFVAQAVAPIAESAHFHVGTRFPGADDVIEVSASSEPQQFGLLGPALVRVTSRSGAVVPGHPVHWSVVSGDARIVAADGSTDTQGAAALQRVSFPTRAGDTVAIVATVPGVQAPNAHTWRFVVAAGQVAAIQVVEGADQVAPSGTAVLVRPRLRLLDDYGNPVGRQSLSFLVRSGGGTIAGTDSTWGGVEEPDTTFIAPEWVLGAPGPQVLRVRLGPLNLPFEFTSIEIRATATAP